MDKIKPNRGKILVEPMPPASESLQKSGLFIPESAVEKHVTPRGKVIAVGGSVFTSNGKEIPPIYKVGETVHYVKASKAVEVKFNGKDCLLISENEILYGDDDAPSPLYAQPEAKVIPMSKEQAEKDIYDLNLWHHQHNALNGVDSLGSKVGKSTPKNS